MSRAITEGLSIGRPGPRRVPYSRVQANCRFGQFDCGSEWQGQHYVDAHLEVGAVPQRRFVGRIRLALRTARRRRRQWGDCARHKLEQFAQQFSELHRAISFADMNHCCWSATLIRS